MPLACSVVLLAAALLVVARPAAAVTLHAGDLLVAGYSYAPSAPDGACTHQLCLVDPGTGAVTPIAAVPNPALSGRVTRLVVESPTRVLALLRTHTGPTTWTGSIVRIDLDTSAVTPIASGLDRPVKIVRTDAGRVFVQRLLGAVEEVNLTTGALTPALAGGYQALAAGAGESLFLVSREETYDEFGDFSFEMIEFDLGAGTSQSLGQFCCSFADLDVGAEGDIYNFIRTGSFVDGILSRFGGPSGPLFYGASEDYQHDCTAIEADSSGNLFLSCDGNPSIGGPLDELVVFSPSGVRTMIDLDFGVGAFTFAPIPEPGTASLLGLGAAALAALRRAGRRRSQGSFS